MFASAVAVVIATACTPASPPAASPEPAADASADVPARAADTPAGAEPEPCRVFVLVREPTVRTSPVANVVAHGDKPGSLVTVIRDDATKELMATTLDEFEESICQRFEPRPYLLHLFKEQGKLVGKLSTPAERADIAHDARTVCGAERLGATILPAGSPEEQRRIGLQQAAGGLTSPKYRALLFGLLHGDKPSVMRLITELDKDIRAQGEAAWDACTILVKK